MNKALHSQPYKTSSKTSLLSSLNNNKLGQLSFEHSSLANLVVLLSSGKIIMANNAAAKLLGYSKKILLTRNISTVFNSKDSFKKIMKRRFEAQKPVITGTILKKTGKPIPCEMNYAVFKDDNGIENVILSIVDMSQHILEQLNIDIKKEKIVAGDIVIAKTKQKNIDTKNKKIVAGDIVIAKTKQKNIDTKNKKIVSDNIIIARAKSDEEKIDYENHGRMTMLTEIEESFRILFNSSSDVLFDSDLVHDKIMVNEVYEKEFGHKKATAASSIDWAAHIHPGDKKAIMKDYYRMLASAEIEWKVGYRFIRSDHSIANVLSSRIILRDARGKAYRMIGVIQDISKQKILEEKLENEIKLKEVQIAEAAEDAKHTERSDIGKELHDNVNQLLGASKLYLELAKRGGERSEIYLNRSSEYTLLAIEEIRKLTKGLTTDIIKNLGLREAIEHIVHDTMETHPIKISCRFIDFKESSVNDKFKLNIFRILQEQLNNILKHAKATKVIISLLQNKNSIQFKISDNGVGFDTAKKRKGIGVANIKSRAASYHGDVNFISQLGKGCVLTAVFSAEDSLLTTP